MWACSVPTEECGPVVYLQGSAGLQCTYRGMWACSVPTGECGPVVYLQGSAGL